MRLDDLGPRLCILGPSNSGKSTLADAIGRARGLPVVHLDQLYHLPHTDWQPRPTAEFIALHDAAIQSPHWVVDGNYSRCLPQRLARATGLILLDTPTPLSLLRYLRRCWFERDRRGALEGGRDSVKWQMLRYIVGTARLNRRRYWQLYNSLELPRLALMGPAELKAFYRREGLER